MKNEYAQGSLKKLLDRVDTASIEAFNDRVNPLFKKHRKDLDISKFEIYPNEPLDEIPIMNNNQMFEDGVNNSLINNIAATAQHNISRSRLHIVKDEMKRLTYGELTEMAEGVKSEANEKDKFGDLAPMLWRWAIKE